MESHKRLLFVHIAQIDRPTMGLTAGFSAKSSTSTFYLQFIHISSFFQIFPKPCCAPTGNPGPPYAPIALASAVRPADDRERPYFRPGRAYANFLLLLAAFYMRLIFPESQPADRLSGPPHFYSRSQNLECSLLFWKTVQER